MNLVYLFPFFSETLGAPPKRNLKSFRVATWLPCQDRVLPTSAQLHFVASVFYFFIAQLGRRQKCLKWPSVYIPFYLNTPDIVQKKRLPAVPCFILTRWLRSKEDKEMNMGSSVFGNLLFTTVSFATAPSSKLRRCFLKTQPLD